MYATINYFFNHGNNGGGEYKKHVCNDKAEYERCIEVIKSDKESYQDVIVDIPTTWIEKGEIKMNEEYENDKTDIMLNLQALGALLKNSNLQNREDITRLIDILRFNADCLVDYFNEWYK